MLGATHHIFAPDSYGSGKSPEWASDREIALRNEVEVIEPVMAQAGSPLTLVGHSYGAALALVAALAKPARIRELAGNTTAAKTLHYRLDCQRPSLGACITHRIHAPGSICGVKRPHSAHVGRAVAGICPCCRPDSDPRASAGSRSRVSRPRPHGADYPSGCGECRDCKIPGRGGGLGCSILTQMPSRQPLKRCEDGPGILRMAKNSFVYMPEASILISSGNGRPSPFST